MKALAPFGFERLSQNKDQDWRLEDGDIVGWILLHAGFWEFFFPFLLLLFFFYCTESNEKQL